MTQVAYPSPHSVRQTDEDLFDIASEVVRAGLSAQGQLEGALYALSTANVAAARSVVEADRLLDVREALIEQACTRFIARRQPTAGDLRAILAAVKIAVQIERIGDEAKKIARVVERVSNDPAWEWMRPTLRLDEVGRHMVDRLRTVLVAYERLDTVAARELLATASSRDALYRGLMRQFVTFMIEDTRSIAAGLDVAWVIRALERIGEHVLNLAEHVIYIVEGVDVRHLEARKPLTPA